MRKKSYGRILKWEPKKQHLRIVPKSCSKLMYRKHLIALTNKDY